MPNRKAKPKTPVVTKFKVGDKVRVKHGVTDTDYPDMPLGSWAGVISEIHDHGMYTVRSTRETLVVDSMVPRKRIEPQAEVEPKSDAQAAQQRLRSLGCPKQAAILARFFKTGPGQYGEGDRFIGVKVPETRKLAKEFKGLSLTEVECLLHTEIHEERLLALVILVAQFEKGDDAMRKRIYDLYLASTKHINNWDLVDLSAPQIVGGYLENRSRKPLDRLAKSASIWERRISILATYWFIRHGDFADTLRIAEKLLTDKEDLIHKAVGWMLREVGKRDVAMLEDYLGKHCRRMPRTMLRYAIERLPDEKRRAYLKGMPQS